MLSIIIPGSEFYDEEHNSFVNVKETTLNLEHSLVSISKWEMKWNKAFLGKKPKTIEQSLDYIRCMTLNQVDPNVYFGLTKSNVSDIYEYINAPMSAVYIQQIENQSPSKDVITSELIYYWMISLHIPFECEEWHINRLLSLIRVCDIKNEALYGGPKRKRNRSTNDLLRRNAALNNARLAKYNTTG